MKVVDGFFRGGGGDDAKKVNKSLSGTADGKAPTKIWLMEEIPMNHLGCVEPYGKNYQPQLVIAGFLKHQQYHIK